MEIEKIREKLKEIIDPEIGFDIVSLGLIEEIKVEKNRAFIKILPTSPFCPYLSLIVEEIYQKLGELNLDVEVEIDFENFWSLERASKEVREKLGLA